MVRTGAAAVDVQPIDRLEEKVKQLVSVIDTLRAEKAKAIDDSARLQQEVAALKARLADAAGASAELATMREERDLIRTRVAQMISHDRQAESLTPGMADSRVVHVDIQGQRYAIRSALDPKYVADSRRSWTSGWSCAGRELATSDAVRIAVIAALNIADELFRTRQDSPRSAQARARNRAPHRRGLDGTRRSRHVRAIGKRSARLPHLTVELLAPLTLVSLYIPCFVRDGFGASLEPMFIDKASCDAAWCACLRGEEA